MNYIEANFFIDPLHPYDDILTNDLAEIGFESFLPTEKGIQAYIQEDAFALSKIEEVIARYQPEVTINLQHQLIPEQNWNANWESNFEPIEVDGLCRIRAPFHPSNPDFKFEICIEPKMSFGTGHHETTYLMLHSLLQMKLSGKAVLDMGCGTSVLAILAAKLGAAAVTAIDNDPWSFQNSLENCELNDCKEIVVKLGDAALLEGLKFDLVIANINRNILLQDLSTYVQSMNPESVILLSGFFDVDAPQLIEHAQQQGLTFLDKLTRNNWALLSFQKQHE